MRWPVFLLFSLFTLHAFAGYSVNLSALSPDVAARLRKIAPEIAKKDLDLNTLNIVLKKIDAAMSFNSLKLVKAGETNELVLVGELSPTVNSIDFSGLSGMTDAEALVLMGLNPANILNESALRSGTEKLADYYHEEGYRSAQVSYEITAESSTLKNINFKVERKKKTKLSGITLQGLAPASISADIETAMRKHFWNATLNQETRNRMHNELRAQLSYYGFYRTDVPEPQEVLSANELSARVIYKVKNTQRYYVEVQNSNRFEHGFLEDDVLKLGTYYSKDENMASDLVEKLKAYYVSQGFPHTDVPVSESKKGDRIYLYLSVEEGPYTRITDFSVVGQYSRPESFYKNKFYELASPAVQDGIYLKSDIELAAKNLLIYLQNDGFVNAKLSRVFISTERENPSHGIVVLQLDEGPQVKIKDVVFKGVSAENLAAVKNVAHLVPGQSLSLTQLELTLINLKNFYQSSGYIEYKLLNENTDLMTYSENNSLATVTFDIQEGPKVAVQSIVTEGNTRTIDKVILIELDFKVGDILTPAKIEESVSRLQRTGQFNSVEITTLEKDTPAAQRTVIVKVTERDPGVRVLGIGVTDENHGTLHGYTGIAYRNFFGRGVGLSARAELNYNFALLRYLEQKYTFGFVWPYLFDTRARFRTSATRSNIIGDVTINKVTEANTAVFSVEQDFTSHFTGIMSYTVTTFKDHGITNEDELKYGYSSESLVIGSIGPTIDIDYRDNLFNPTKGSFSRFSAEYAADYLGNNNADDFYRLTAQTTHYFPYKETGIVFVQSLQGGYLRDIDADKNEGIPYDKRGFTLGGRTTIRGFESSEFFPSTTELGVSYRMTTSASYELVKSELRFPISYKYDIAGAVFYDGGRVQIEGVNLLDGWRDAVGVGLRYNTPVGPLNLEYAQKLDKRAGESDGAFHLSVGVF